MRNQSNHSHEFPRDEPYFIFEDVLVNENIECINEFCDERQVRQFEVDFTSFEQEGDRVSENTAETLWYRICETFETDDVLPHIDGSRDTYERSTHDGSRGYIIEYDTDNRIAGVCCYFDDTEITFDVEFYRQLS